MTYAALLNKLCHEDLAKHGSMDRNRIAAELKKYTPKLGRNKRSNDVFKAIVVVSYGGVFEDRYNRNSYVVMP